MIGVNLSIDETDILLLKCDMIKGNELDVADIVFEILAKKEVKISVTRHSILMGFAPKCSKVVRKRFQKLKIEKSSTCDSFPLIMSQMVLLF